MRREEIMQAAIRVFAARGYHAAKVSEIVKEAGVAQGTFYLYFQSKQAIFGEIIENFLRLLSGALTDWQVQEIDSLERLKEDLRGIGLRMSGVMVENQEVTRIFFEEALAVHPTFNKLVSDFYDRVVRILNAVHQICFERGIYRHQNFTVLSYAILGMVERVVYQYIVRGGLTVEEAEPVIHDLIEITMHGASRQLGKE
ncbi:MAG: TetR/AcrR family transcriptional regulator [Myxococcales bacterium]|nr:TetR/AcrR family transcriptional regulator [Myxococcales bacterium]